MKPRISLRGLIGLTTLAGLACAALVQPSAAWTGIAISLLVAGIIVQVIRLIEAEGAQRAAVVGWLVFVTAYLAVALGPWLSTHVGRHLLTSQAIALARQEWPSRLDQPQSAPVVTHVWQDVDLSDNFMMPALWGSGAAVPPGWVPEAPNYFRLSAHWLFAWLAGWLGAILATHFFHRRAASEHRGH